MHKNPVSNYDNGKIELNLRNFANFWLIQKDFKTIVFALYVIYRAKCVAIETWCKVYEFESGIGQKTVR